MTAIAKKALVTQPHERRVQRFAFGALAGTLAVGVALALQSPGRLFGLTIPPIAGLAALAVGAVLGAVAVARRSSSLSLGAGALLVLGVTPGGVLQPGILGYALGLAFGVLLLAFLELVQQTSRYDRAHKLVEQEGVPEESLDRVTDEAVKTLGTRAGFAVALAAAGALLAVGLSYVGPAAWREGIETAAPLGVAVATLLVLAAVTLTILVRGARFKRSSAEASSDIPEVAP